MKSKKLSIREIIVVEGRDDTAAINRAVDAITIETHGYGISEKTFQKISKAYETKGIIIFTDPDFAGKNIRKRLKNKFPKAKEAFLSQEKATKSGNIGIENAKPDSIVEALKKAKCTEKGICCEITKEDMVKYHLIGNKEAKKRRELLGDKLGIGYSNGKNLLKKLNGYGITKKEFLDCIEYLEKK